MWYIITWCLITTIPAITIHYDKYGRVSPLTRGVTEYSRSYSVEKAYDCDHKKFFNNKDSAIVFYIEAEMEAALNREVCNIKLDSI